MLNFTNLVYFPVFYRKNISNIGEEIVFLEDIFIKTEKLKISEDESDLKKENENVLLKIQSKLPLSFLEIKDFTYSIMEFYLGRSNISVSKINYLNSLEQNNKQSLLDSELADLELSLDLSRKSCMSLERNYNLSACHRFSILHTIFEKLHLESNELYSSLVQQESKLANNIDNKSNNIMELQSNSLDSLLDEEHWKKLLLAVHSFIPQDLLLFTNNKVITDFIKGSSNFNHVGSLDHKSLKILINLPNNIEVYSIYVKNLLPIKVIEKFCLNDTLNELILIGVQN